MNYTLKFYNTYIAKYKKGGRISKAEKGGEARQSYNDSTVIDSIANNLTGLSTDTNYIYSSPAERDTLYYKIISGLPANRELTQEQIDKIRKIINKQSDYNKKKLMGVNKEEITDIIYNNPAKPRWQARTSSLIKEDMKKESIFDKGIYKVQKGDTPWGIAKAAGISLKKLAEYNPEKVDGDGKWRTIYAGDVFNLKNPINPDDFKFSLNVDDVINDDLKQNKLKQNKLKLKPMSTLPRSKSLTVKVNLSLKPSISINEMTDESLPLNQLISYYGKKPKRIGVSVVLPVSLSALIPTYYPYTANKSYDLWAGAEGII